MCSITTDSLAAREFLMGRATKKHSVDRTRLTWVLAVLVASMTIGTVVLGVLEPSHALSAEAKYLAATYHSPPAEEISNTRTPISSATWDAIIIHQVGSDMRLSSLASGRTSHSPLAHFVVNPQAEVLVTVQWAKQKHIRNYRGKIQVGLQLPPGQGYASLEQAQTIVSLLRYLQARCDIHAGRVYLHGELSERACGGDPLACFTWRKNLRQ